MSDGFQLRRYQHEAIQAIGRAKEKGATSGILHMATGTGKTIVTHEVVNRFFTPQEHRTLIIGGINTHLVHQMVRSFKKHSPELSGFYGENGYSQPGIGMVMANYDEVNARVVVASIQTLLPSSKTAEEDYVRTPITESDLIVSSHGVKLNSKSKLEYLVSPRVDAILSHGLIDLWVHDEVHHAPADGSLYIIRRMKELYRVLNASPFFILGNTATPLREDGRSLANVCESIFYSYPLQKAQDEGNLAPFAEPIHVAFDIGDSVDGEEITKLKNWDDQIVETWNDKCNNDGVHRPTVIYSGSLDGLSGVECSRVLAQTFNDSGIAAAHIDATSCLLPDGRVGTVDDRFQIFEMFERGEIKVLCNYSVIAEGVDIPPISCVMLLRMPSEVQLTQMLGRAIRTFYGNNYLPEKEDTLVIDFTGKRMVLAAAASLMGYIIDENGVREDVDLEALFIEFNSVYALRKNDILESIPNLSWDISVIKAAIKCSLKKRIKDYIPVFGRILRRLISWFSEDEVLLEGGSIRDMTMAGYVHGVDRIYSYKKIYQGNDDAWHPCQYTSFSTLPVSGKSSLLIHPPLWTRHAKVEHTITRVEGLKEDNERLLTLLGMIADFYSTFTLWEIDTSKLYKPRAKLLFGDSNPNILVSQATNYALHNMESEDIFMKKKRRWKQRKIEGQLVQPTRNQLYAVKALAGKIEVQPELEGSSKGEVNSMIAAFAGALAVYNNKQYRQIDALYHKLDQF
jgi:superfamily II DNA or RNA helicase